MNCKKNIAILFFSRRAKAEVQFKQWLPQATGLNSELADSLIFQTYNTVSNTGLPVYHVHEGMQRGRTFGERFANAFQRVFDLGFDGVIAVGNDSPGLAQLDWEFPVASLNADRCVLGPTKRGGTYLIALTREQFRKSSFERISWQTNKVLAELLVYCQGEQEPLILEAFRDLNSSHDLKIFIRSSGKSNSFSRFILRLLHRLKSWCRSQVIILYRLENEFCSWSLRAPPSRG